MANEINGYKWAMCTTMKVMGGHGRKIVWAYN